MSCTAIVMACARAPRPGSALLALTPLVLAALGNFPVAATAQAHKSGATEPTAPYVTKSGDTLYAIAAQYLRNSQDWKVLSRLNHVPAPRRMQPGIELRLPVALLKQERLSASVVDLNGPVEHAYRDGPFSPLDSGATLGEGDVVRTGHNGFVTLELADGTHLSVSQDSMIDLGTLRRTVLTGATDREINLRRGEVDSEVTHATKPDDRFQIHSPSVVAGVRGTRFRVNYDLDGQVSAVEVLEGTVDVGASAAKASPSARQVQGVLQPMPDQMVHAHFGSVTHLQGTVGVPVALLAAPQLSDPAKMQDEPAVAFDLIRETHVDAPHAAFSEVPDGTYFVRISAVDGNALEGLPQIYAFQRRQFGLAASAGPRAASRDYEFRWLTDQHDVETRFRFVLARTPDLRDPIVDQVDISAGKLVVSDLPRGVYYWTVVGEQFENGKFYEKASAIRSFTLDY